MDTKELLKTTPETLADKQINALLKEVKAKLSKLVSHLEKAEYSAAFEMLGNSPAGDGHGCENQCINFSDVMEPVDQGCFTDIGEVIDKMQRLSVVLGKGKKKR